jgi:uncharacterized protein YecE (DUF72 family)
LILLRDLYSGPTVLEPRHPTWFTVEAADLLHQFEIARVAADPAPVSQAAAPGGWKNLIYRRLHGSPHMYYSAYDGSYLQSLAATIRHQREFAEVWCILDNTASGAALGDALTLQRLTNHSS